MMHGHFDEDRRFFLEIIDDMASMEIAVERINQVPPEQLERETREDKAWIEAVDEVEQDSSRPEDRRESTPEWFRERLSKVSDRELLLRRRSSAKLVCEWMVQVGRLHFAVYDDILGHSIQRLRTMDAEIARRHLGRDQAPRD
jgi:hypothetical protein